MMLTIAMLGMAMILRYAAGRDFVYNIITIVMFNITMLLRI